jgi:hypothetical protein
MEEILPGIHHWTTFHDGIGARVHSYYAEPAAALIDPMVPEEGLEAFAGMVEPRHVLMTNRHHFRHSDRFREAFGCVVRASAPGMGDLEGRDVEPFRFGDEVAPGITALEIGVLCPDETALHITDGGGAVAFADALVRTAGTLGFVPDPLLGDDPRAIRHGLKAAFRGLLPLHFDALLFAHGVPQPSGGRAALHAFAGEPA